MPAATWRALALAFCALCLPAAAQETQVDLELVLAIDVSQSVDIPEGRLQRHGYVQAFRHPRVLEAIQQGRHARIAVTYIEWAGPGLWRSVVDWRTIEDKEQAHAFASLLERTPVARATGTSISGAIEVGMGLLDRNKFAGTRRVIDISGDGPNNGGTNVARARDIAVAAGVTINGVAINNFDGSAFSLPDLDVYYDECVIGGGNAFVIAADGFESFAAAILRKLILEIADAQPEARIVPAQARREAPPRGTRAQKYAPACDIGERMRFFDNQGLPPPGR